MTWRNQFADVTRCVNGHEFTAENTYHRKTGGRACRACDRHRQRRKRLQGGM